MAAIASPVMWLANKASAAGDPVEVREALLPEPVVFARELGEPGGCQAVGIHVKHALLEHRRRAERERQSVKPAAV